MPTIYEKLKTDHDKHRRLLRELAKTEGNSPERRTLWNNFYYDVSAHAAAEELALAAQMGVDFVTLSPVQATATHPEAQPLGWDAASELLAGCNLPAYLLGGVGPSDIERAWQVGAQGVAGIRALWPDAAL